MAFSEVLVQKRKSRGLSQEALAEQLGVSRQAVSKWETGEASPDLNKLLALSKVLNTSLDTLCGLQKDSAAGTTPASPKRRLFSTALLLILILLAGILIGVFIANYAAGNSTAEHTGVPAPSVELPASITVTGLAFSPEDDGVTYQFTPGFISPDCTYQITFAATGEEPTVCDTVPTGGVCTGRAALDPWNNYTVTVTVSNGETTRAVSVAYDLSYQPSQNGENGIWGGGSTSWHPVD